MLGLFVFVDGMTLPGPASCFSGFSLLFALVWAVHIPHAARTAGVPGLSTTLFGQSEKGSPALKYPANKCTPLMLTPR
jgi:hypothetical protein